MIDDIIDTDTQVAIINDKAILKSQTLWLNREQRISKKAILIYIELLELQKYNTGKNHNCSVLLNSLYRAYSTDRYLTVPCDNQYYADMNALKRYKKFKHTRAVVDIAKHLASNNYVTIHIGIKNNHTTLIEVKPKLKDVFKQHRIKTEDIQEVNNLIYLRDSKKQNIDYAKKITKTKIGSIEMNLNIPMQKKIMDKINRILEIYTISYKTGTKYRISERSDFELEALPTEDNKKHYISLTNTKFCRIFNNNFDTGGRFYGHYVQSFSGDERKGLKIKNILTGEMHSVCECDYNYLHIKMLYDISNQTLDTDPYIIKGYVRKDIKIMFFMMLNASSEEEAIHAFLKNKLKKGIFFDIKIAFEMVQVIKLTNVQIRQYFCGGMGIFLQRFDSEIASIILGIFADKDKPIFSIHDSFLVINTDKDLLIKSMRMAYKEVLKQDAPPIQQK